jgi:4-amino-4-deoxy-L-arabinose transferase-like glycosyltransferase
MSITDENKKKSMIKWDLLMIFYCMIYFIILGYINTKFLDLTNPDESIYIRFAYNLQETKLYTYAFNPPGLSYLIMLVGNITGNYIYAAKWINAFFCAFFIWMSYHLCTTFFPKDYSKIYPGCIAILISILPEFLQYSRYTNTDVPFGTFLLISIYFLQKDFSNNQKYLIGIAISSGLMSLFRWTGLILVPIIIFMIYLQYKKNNSKQDLKTNYYSRLFGHIVLYLVIFLVVMTPWFIHNAVNYGSPLFNRSIENLINDRPYSGGSGNTWNNNNFFDLLINEGDYIFLKLIKNMLLEIPFSFFYQNSYVNDGNYFFKIIMAIIFYFILGLGIRHFSEISEIGNVEISYKSRLSEMWTNLTGKNYLFIVILIISYSIFISFGWIIFRFLIPIYPIFLVFFILGLKKLLNFISNSNKFQKLSHLFKTIQKHKISRYSLQILLVMSVIVSFSFNYSTLKENPSHYRIAGKYLKNNGNRNDVILAYNDHYYNHYADMVQNPYITENYISNLQTYMENVKGQEFDYLIISEEVDLGEMSYLSIFLSSNCSFLSEMNLNLIYSLPSNIQSGNYSLVIYEST